jgi:hypothetical protein
MNRDVKMSSLETFGQLHRLCRQIHVEHRSTGIAMEMTVFVHVRTITRRAAIQRDLPGESAFHERIEAVIDRGVGDLRHLFFGTDEDFVGGWMIAFVQQHVINLLTLRCEAQTGRAQLFGQVLLVLLVAARLHFKKFTVWETEVKI